MDFEGARADLTAVEAGRVAVTIPADRGAAKFRQHFAFDVVGRVGDDVEVALENAGDCTWADAFAAPYRVFVSDGGPWRRAATSFDQRTLTVGHTLERPRARFAYYPPFPSSRLTRLRKIGRAAGMTVERLGVTPEGRPLERFLFGEGAGKKQVWVIAQQHPGEAMAGWFVEGLVLALAGGRSLARALLERATVHVVPRMNPDGVAAGNHRTTPLGVDLNRSWADPRAPIEVSSVRAAMAASGADVFVDVHGDERLPWVFTQTADAFSGRPQRIARASQRFERALSRTTPDFQTRHKYPYDPSGSPNLSFASNWAQEQLGCLAMVLEMPFSDHLGKPDEARGFSPDRARALGRAVIAGLLAAID